MAKIAICALLLAVCGIATVAGVEVEQKCTAPTENIPHHWVDMQEHCLNAIRYQISKEVNASYAYLALGAHFSQDTVNLNGFAKLFFDHASEEREHAEGLIEYMLMRGPAQNSYFFGKELIQFRFPEVKVTSALEALNVALQMEKDVTESIKGVISKCDQVETDGATSDYHLSDHLTGVYLEEQYKGMRELIGKISTLEKMKKASGALGEFLYDKELLA